MSWEPWQRRLRHDLVKRLVWPARDRRDMGGAPLPGELLAKLSDDEGRPATAATVWAALQAEAPEPQQAALAEFERALAASLAAAERNDLHGVLALEDAFDRLVQVLAREGR
jgi:hypothetical protein